MEICVYTPLYGPDHNAGAQTMLRDMLRPLAKAGHTINVVVQHPTHRTESYVYDGIAVHPTLDRKTLVHWLPRADVVICHLESVERAALLAKQYGRAVVQIVHNDMAQTHSYLNYKCDLAVFNTDWVRGAFPEYKGRSMVVHPPIDPTEYKGKRGDKITLINLWGNKGAALFYDLAKRMPDHKFLGVLGGYGVQDVRVAHNVEIHNHTADMREVYAKTRVLLMPSVYESFGRCALEAAASGIPTVAAPTVGLQEALGDAGIFVPPNRITEWEQAIRGLYDTKTYATASKLAAARSRRLLALTERELLAWTDAIALLGR